jgi:hypothetical protein
VGSTLSRLYLPEYLHTLLYATLRAVEEGRSIRRRDTYNTVAVKSYIVTYPVVLFIFTIRSTKSTLGERSGPLAYRRGSLPDVDSWPRGCSRARGSRSFRLRRRGSARALPVSPIDDFTHTHTHKIRSILFSFFFFFVSCTYLLFLFASSTLQSTIQGMYTPHVLHGNVPAAGTSLSYIYINQEIHGACLTGSRIGSRRSPPAASAAASTPAISNPH